MPGRNRLIDGFNLKPNQTILEMACGTGRNLAVASKVWPGAKLYGMDISSQMLATAKATLASKLTDCPIEVKLGDAAEFSAQKDFGVAGFDRIFFSYALSMIPDWTKATEQALKSLVPGGELHVIDFGDLAGWPNIARNRLYVWLNNFHVEPRLTMQNTFKDLAVKYRAKLNFQPLYGGYAWKAIVRLDR